MQPLTILTLSILTLGFSDLTNGCSTPIDSTIQHSPCDGGDGDTYISGFDESTTSNNEDDVT